MISVILPAARDRERAEEIVHRLWRNVMVSQVVVSSPSFEVSGVTNVRDANAGSSRAIAQAYSAVRPGAEYVAWLSDICIPELGALDRMRHYLACRPGLHVAEFRTVPPVTQGHYRVCTILGRQYARWGMLARRTAEATGGFFDETFVSHYGDVDLSLRCWRAGGEVSTCVDAVVEVRGHSHPSTAPESGDEAVFIERWRSAYPQMRKDNTAEWNVDRECPL